jgi:hypothetical protein
MSRNSLASVLIVTALLSVGTLHAQTAESTVGPALHAVYVEVGGPAGVASMNYDRRISEDWTIRVGLEIDGSGPQISEWYPEVPITVSYLAFGGDHHAEVGGGYVVTAGSRYNDGFDSTLHLGYRYQSPAFPLFFRAVAVRRASEHYRLPGLPVWGGIGVGYSF